MQREQVLEHALNVLEQKGSRPPPLSPIWRRRWTVQFEELQRFWPDREALLYDALRYHSQQIDILATSAVAG